MDTDLPTSIWSLVNEMQRHPTLVLKSCQLLRDAAAADEVFDCKFKIYTGTQEL